MTAHFLPIRFMQMKRADLRLVDLLFPGLPSRRFTYKVPDRIIVTPSRGTRVTAPFRGKDRVGIVAGHPARTVLKESKIQELTEVLEQNSLINQENIALARWISRYYLCSETESLRLVMPAGAIKRSNPLIEILSEPEKPLKGRRQKEIFDYLSGEKSVRIRELKRAFPKVSIYPVLRSLEKKKIVRITEQPLSIPGKRKGRTAPLFALADFPEDSKVEISTPGQAEIIGTVSKAIDAGGFTPFLLHGITGSGKTHVYLELVERVLARGKTALVLVPEIALTPQLSSRFAARYPGEVAIIHSGISRGARMAIWRKAAACEIRVVIGARSAVFVPLPKTGLIIVDEEQDQSYKQIESPAYNARDVALVKGRISGAAVLLGSATPSLESYHNAEKGKYKLLHLNERIDGRKLPSVDVVDMRLELRTGNRSPISGRLVELLEENLARNEQAILLLNRRGFFSFMQCSGCGEAIECPDCSVTLTLHKVSDSLMCHFCGYARTAPSRCAACGKEVFRYKGAGTQEIETVVKGFFPSSRVLRMDLDSTRRKGAHGRILGAFARKEADILVGTQMVAKGHDFPGVTLVGIISADVGLHFPDFRASERTFQLLIQAAGRAGRHDLEGRVVLQTYQPDHYSVQAACLHSFKRFYEKEKGIRAASGYPPFSRMIHIKVFSQDLESARKISREIAARIRKASKGAGGVDLTVIGPAPFPIRRIKKEYIWHIILKTGNIIGALEYIRLKEWDPGEHPEARISVIVDPAGIL